MKPAAKVVVFRNVRRCIRGHLLVFNRQSVLYRPDLSITAADNLKAAQAVHHCLSTVLLPYAWYVQSRSGFEGSMQVDSCDDGYLRRECEDRVTEHDHKAEGYRLLFH